MCQFFKPYIARLFGISISDIKDIGDDDYTHIQTFKRTAKADLEITKDNTKYTLEIQSGFQGINDVKQHKVLESKRVFDTIGQKTILIHFDIFNGQVALIMLQDIEDNDVNWITRPQMEGQVVFNINQNHFKVMLNKPFKGIDTIDTYFND